MSSQSFFDESQEQSQVKSAIVTKYFVAWSRVIKNAVKSRDGRMLYLDLFAGPGRYKDGTKSTPLLVLEEALRDPDLCKMLVTKFNDRDPEHADSLTRAIASMPGISALTHAPDVDNRDIDDSIADKFQSIKLMPTFSFFDPWGYKGLSLKLIRALLKDWGCDCVFFFNYNRINMGVSNELVRQHIDAIFGPERGARLRDDLNGLSPYDREMTIVAELCDALKDLGGKFVLPFGFKNAKGTRTTHHLFFVSKNVRGYDIMKSIMARESSVKEQGVARFEYSPADSKYPLLFELCRPIDDLRELLLSEFAGMSLTMQQVFERHNVGRPFIAKNYKDALRALEASGSIATNPPAIKRRMQQGLRTFGENVEVHFPERSGK